MSRETSEHARPPGDGETPSFPEPSYSERCRTLLHLARVGTLSTISRKLPDWPFGSVAPYGLDAAGAPTFLISTMAMHTQNLLANDRASLLVAEPGATSDPLGAGRVTLMGRVRRTRDDELADVRQRYLERYENASYWVDFKDFAFFQMDVVDLYFVGGFGVMGWVEAPEYVSAAPDPLADVATGIIEHMNADHTDAMALLAKAVHEIEGEEAKMTSVDRLGFHMRLKTASGMKGLRIPFTSEVRDADETRRVLVEMVRRHR